MAYAVTRFPNGIVLESPERFLEKVLDVAWSLPKAFTGEWRAANGRAQAGDPLTRPAPAEENAGAVHPLPQGGEGHQKGGALRAPAGA
jgi:hypothetical protein